MSATSLTWDGRSIPGPGGLPAVAVSLTGPSLAQVRTQARSAIDAGADVLELRVDLLEEAGALAAPAPLDAATAAAQVLECLRGLREAIAADGADAGAPVLLTCRTAAEGGRAQLDDTAYGSLLRSVLDGLTDWAPERRPAAIDIEVQRGCLPQVCAQAHALSIDVVASFHDFEATPQDAVMLGRLRAMAEAGADVVKLAVMPRSAHDVARLLGVTARASEELDVPVVTMSMGALGTVSRVSGAVFGSALTFATAGGASSAPGQLPIGEVRRCMALLGTP